MATLGPIIKLKAFNCIKNFCNFRIDTVAADVIETVEASDHGTSDSENDLTTDDHVEQEIQCLAWL